VNAWNWRPTLDLLLNEDLIDGERHELLGAHGCGAGVDEELAGRIAEAIERKLKLADMKAGMRMRADLSVTSVDRKPIVFTATASTDGVDQNEAYSATYEWLVTFKEFCARSGGFDVF
jgi:hypothetical protein